MGVAEGRKEGGIVGADADGDDAAVDIGGGGEWEDAADVEQLKDFDNFAGDFSRKGLSAQGGALSDFNAGDIGLIHFGEDPHMSRITEAGNGTAFEYAFAGPEVNVQNFARKWRADGLKIEGGLSFGDLGMGDLNGDFGFFHDFFATGGEALQDAFFAMDSGAERFDLAL